MQNNIYLDSVFKINNTFKIEKNHKLINKSKNNLETNNFKKEESNISKYKKVLNEKEINQNQIINFIYFNQIERTENNSSTDFETIETLEKDENKKSLKFTNSKYYISLLKEIEILKNVNNLFDYNKNLFIIRTTEWEKLNHYGNEKEFYIKDKMKKKLFDKNYYPDIFKQVIKNINNEQSIDNSSLLSSNEEKISQNIKRRHIKTKDDIEYLKKIQKEYNFKWSKELIEELSKKLFLSKRNIYSWNYDRIRASSKNKIKK